MTGEHRRTRIHIFVDFSNLELTMNEKAGYGFRFDWQVLPEWLVREAVRVGRLSDVAYAGTHVYASYDPASAGSGRFRSWLTNWLDRLPGVQVVAKERRPRRAVRAVASISPPVPPAGSICVARRRRAWTRPS